MTTSTIGRHRLQDPLTRAWANASQMKRPPGTTSHRQPTPRWVSVPVLMLYGIGILMGLDLLLTYQLLKAHSMYAAIPAAALVIGGALQYRRGYDPRMVAG